MCALALKICQGMVVKYQLSQSVSGSVDIFTFHLLVSLKMLILCVPHSLDQEGKPDRDGGITLFPLDPNHITVYMFHMNVYTYSDSYDMSFFVALSWHCIALSVYKMSAKLC